MIKIGTIRTRKNVIKVKAIQTANLIRSICLLIMVNTLLLRSSLHFTTLHPTTLHSSSLHLSTLHFLSFKLNPNTLHYSVISLNPI